MLSKTKRKIYARKMREFWIDFSHNRIGFAGLLILIVFIIGAFFAPVLAPENPIGQKRVAAPYALPDWITIFNPELTSKPPTIHYPLNATVSPENSSCPEISVEYPSASEFSLKYVDNKATPNQNKTYVFDFKFNYSYDEPPGWSIEAHWKAEFTNLSYRFELYFISSNGSEWIIWGRDYDIVTRRVIVLPQVLDLKYGSLRVESGSTYLKRRLYYEEFYQKLLPYYLEKYPFANITFPPEFVSFTHEGFKNFTLKESSPSLKDPNVIVENPIYTVYKNLKQQGEINITWREYWEAWINSTDAQIMWEVISQFVQERWQKFASAFMLPQLTVYIDENVTNTIYRAWILGQEILGTDTPYNAVPWREIATILNLTLSEELSNYTIIDLIDEYQRDISNATESNPAYHRWINLPENATISWDDYWKLWLDIQYYKGRTTFENKYLKSLRIGPEVAEEYAKKEAYNLAATSPTPTYYLANKGTQTIRFYLFIVPHGEKANLTITFYSDKVNPSVFSVWGARHGLLGTNSFGFDVWTQLIHGARISLIVGALAAILSTSLGIFFGVLSGYVGGIADEVTMRIVDVLLCLPVLPLLLALSAYFRPNVYYLVIIIAIFGWQGLSRVIRSRVLTLRELPFIESAKASGASSSYLLIRHLIPNVFPIAMASLVLSVPGAILTEAALSYLGFGDPFAPTWGKMLHEAQSEGAFHALAWWYILPPGLAITFLCVAFVFVGHALDEIVNPRLRRRR